jgi:hypothetical protein
VGFRDVPPMQNVAVILALSPHTGRDREISLILRRLPDARPGAGGHAGV